MLVDIFLAVKKQLEEEQDNNDYMNWQDAFLFIQLTTVTSNAFNDIINELKEFVTPQIQKLHYNEMELAFNYDAKILDKSYIDNEKT